MVSHSLYHRRIWFLGTYYLTRPKEGCKGEGKTFGSFNEVLLAYESKVVDVNAIINVRYKDKWYKNTSVGRVIINSIIPDEIDYVDDTIDKGCLLYTSPSPRDRTRSRMPSSA